MEIENLTFCTLCHITDYYTGQNNGFKYGVNTYDNENLDQPLDCIWFKSENERQKFINDENIIIKEN